MSKYRFFLILIVLLIGVLTSSANYLVEQKSNLTFIDPMQIGLQDMSQTRVGAGSYQLETELYGQIAALDLHFWNLEPNTGYVLWCFTIPSSQEGQQYSAPCLENGSEISLRSDANGDATLSAHIPALLSSNSTRFSMIALVSDLESYGYGAARTEIAVESYIQFLAILPTPLR